jgi:hypothetical protein
MKIGIDLDDVLAEFVSPLLRFINERYGTSYKKEDVTDYRLEKVWECTPEEAIRRLNMFYRSAYFEDLPPMPGSNEGIKYLYKHNNLFIITSRPPFLQEETREWISTYFPCTFLDIIHTSSKNRKLTKAEICHALGVSLLIEDRLETALRASQVTNVFLYDQPWNQSDLPPNIHRVRNWEEVIESLTKIHNI